MGDIHCCQTHREAVPMYRHCTIIFSRVMIDYTPMLVSQIGNTWPFTCAV